MTFDKAVEYRKAILTYNPTCDAYLQLYMKEKNPKMNQVHARNLKSVNNSELFLPKLNVRFFRRLRLYSVQKILNDMQYLS